MASLYANLKYPNNNGWQDRHKAAIDLPRGIERGIVHLLKSWQLYASEYAANQDGALIGNDYVLGDDGWIEIGKAIRVLLNGPTDRLDCGTLDRFIIDTFHKYGVTDIETR